MDCRHRLVFREPAGARIRFGPGTDLRLAFGEHLSVLTSELPDYDGAYIIIPAAVDQVMPTNMHSMRDDVTVTAVPYYETSNEAGGMTVSILS